jgi:hypothetical protein
VLIFKDIPGLAQDLLNTYRRKGSLLYPLVSSLNFRKIFMLKKLPLIALVVIFSGASVAAEQSLYTKIDANKDGTINKQEASAYPVLTEKWEELDINADGTLDQAEFAKFEVINE